MLAESSLCRHLQWCAHDIAWGGLKGSKSRACAGGGKEKKQQQKKNKPSSSPPRQLLFNRKHEDDDDGDDDGDGERMTSLAAALSENSSSSAALPSESSSEQQAATVSSQQPIWKRDTRDSLAMEPFDSNPADQMRDEDLWHFRHGPLPGDLAEVEAFCRIFRIAQQVHNAIMEALRLVNDARELVGPRSVGYNGMLLGDLECLEAQDIPLLEEKVVSGLGCIGALLHQQKQEVLGGRLSLGFMAMARDDSIPPLAQFRVEMKRCCEQLEVLLLCYFPADDDQFMTMHKKFQKLRNVCLDAGYPRAEGSPNHADIPNWGAVRSKTPWNEKTSETDNEVVFWRGGQVTDDGVHWLVDRGFKVITDLRSEDSVDHLAKSAIAAAVSSGKLRHISLPVDPGNNPTKDQVMEFAKLVADTNNRPLYLHSQKGVGRTSAMVARWREISLLSPSLEDHATHDLSNDHIFSLGVDKKLADNLLQCEGEISGQADVRTSTRSLEHINNDSFEALGEQRVTLQEAAAASTPFEAQRPELNYFSRQDMSKFLKGRQVSQARFRWKRSSKATKFGSTQGDEVVPLITSVAEPAGRWGLDGPGIPRAGEKDSSYDVADESTRSGSIDLYGLAERTENIVSGKQEEPTLRTSYFVSEQKSPTNGALFRVSGISGGLADDIDEVTVVGDMCASMTGVVRLQSRKKAEMYLVRTDGFSCTREKVKESTLAFSHPSTQQQMLMWKTAPKTVLLLKKLGTELMQEAQQVASFLYYKEGMNVIVEPEVHDHFARVSGFGFIQTFYNQDISDLHERVDFVVCLGGDGVILHASNLFRNAVPPVVSFNLGSLGFLTAHPFEDFMQDLRAIIHGNTMVEGVYITLRMRLRCEFFRNGKSVPGKIFDVLNEVVVDRGSNPYLCKIECYERNRLITKVQADGVIVATPTGSTAYSTAAGGSMVHPNVPCMLFTPICPHSLSFRPVILPDSALLELKVPEDARSNAWVSFDGKRRQQLSRGDSVRVCMSQHPLPTVNKSDQTDDWFRSLVRCLNWNERLEQKALPTSL